MPSSDVEYYRQRASAERELARDAERADVAAIHEELARQHEALVNRADLRPTLRAASDKIAQAPTSDTNV